MRVREAPKVVETHDMIGVRMRENYCVHIADIFAKRLGPEIGPVSTTKAYSRVST